MMPKTVTKIFKLKSPPWNTFHQCLQHFYVVSTESAVFACICEFIVNFHHFSSLSPRNISENSNLLHLFHKNSLKPWKPDNFRSKFPQKSPITHTATTSNWAPSPPYVTHRSKQRAVTEIPKSKNYFLKKIPSIQNVPGSCNRWHRMRQDQSLWSIPKVLRRASRQCRCHIQRK